MDVDDVDTSDFSEEEDDVPVRYRPVFVARQQWNSRDPRLEAMQKRAEKYRRDMIKLYGHPFLQ